MGWKTDTQSDRRKCPKHNTWKKKNRYTGVTSCEICRLEADKRQQEYEKIGGSNKPPVRIIKL